MLKQGLTEVVTQSLLAFGPKWGQGSRGWPGCESAQCGAGHKALCPMRLCPWGGRSSLASTARVREQQRCSILSNCSVLRGAGGKDIVSTLSQNKNDGELPREMFVRQHSCFYRPTYLRHHQWVPVSAGEAGTGLVVMPLHRQCYGTWPLLAKKTISYS